MGISRDEMQNMQYNRRENGKSAGFGRDEPHVFQPTATEPRRTPGSTAENPVRIRLRGRGPSRHGPVQGRKWSIVFHFGSFFPPGTAITLKSN